MSNLTRRSFMAGAGAVAAAAAAACTAERTADYYGAASGGQGALIGVSMPTKNLERWSRDGENLKTLLTDLGYTVELQFADNKVEQQNSQL